MSFALRWVLAFGFITMWVMIGAIIIGAPFPWWSAFAVPCFLMLVVGGAISIIDPHVWRD